MIRQGKVRVNTVGCPKSDTHQTIPGRNISSLVASIRLKHMARDVGHLCPGLLHKA
jgi:hypothetical protein